MSVNFSTIFDTHNENMAEIQGEWNTYANYYGILEVLGYYVAQRIAAAVVVRRSDSVRSSQVQSGPVRSGNIVSDTASECSETARDYLVQAHEGPGHYEEDIGGVDVDEGLLGDDAVHHQIGSMVCPSHFSGVESLRCSSSSARVILYMRGLMLRG